MLLYNNQKVDLNGINEPWEEIIKVGSEGKVLGNEQGDWALGQACHLPCRNAQVKRTRNSIVNKKVHG